MKWTAEQQEAIRASGNLLVSAAAGSGKTAVLTERIVRLMAEGAEISDFLCVTFTNAAAGEMKKRIARRLLEAAEAAGDEAEKRRLASAAWAAGGANISTMHSFCAEVLRRHFHEAGLDPAFRVGDDAEMLVLRSEVYDEVAERRYASATGRFQALIDALGQSEEQATRVILKLYDSILAQPEPLEWLRAAVAAYGANEAHLARADIVGRYLELCASELQIAADRVLLELGGLDLNTPAGKLMACEADAARRALAVAQDYDAYREALGTITFDRISWKGIDKAQKKRAESARDGLKGAVKRQREALGMSLAMEAEALCRAQGIMEELCDTVADLSDAFAAAKAERSAIDYADMEHMTLRLLGDPAIAAEYRDRFKYILVDEYQDSNLVQERIVDAIRRPDNLFLVGDVKQSIYRFRMAEPGLFIERYGRYAAGRGGKRIDLSANFRSASRVIGAVNGIFSCIMGPGASEVTYDEAARLIKGREDAEDAGGVELHVADMFLTGPEDDGEGEDEESFAASEIEAQIAAERILELMATQTVPDEGTGKPRPIRFSDIAVLLRSHRDVADVWTDTLSFSGVPAYAELTGGFFDAVEVRVFMDLLRVIDNRRQDIPLAAVLRSPIGGFDTAELARLRAEYPMTELLDSLEAAARAEYRSDISHKAERILQRLAKWQRESRLVNVETLIGMLLDDTGYARFVSALPGGAKRAGNLEALLARARMYERSGIRGLSAFIDFMDKVENNASLGEAQTAGADVVRVMSVHRSKGLEFPVVILAGMNKRFNETDLRSPIVVDPKLGVGLRFLEGAGRTETLLHRAISSLMRRKLVSEEMRLLYVAMTRAKQRLILLAAVPNAEKAVEDAAVPMDAERAAAASSFLGWALGACMRTEDGKELAERFCIEGACRESGLGIDAKLHYAHGRHLQDERLSKGDYARFAARARADYADATPYDPVFDRRYPFEADTAIPSKLSVTGLSGGTVELVEAPGFIAADERLGPADRGTAAHRLMQYIPIKAHTPQTVREAIDELFGFGILDERQAASVNAKAVAEFFASPLGRRLVASDRVERELEFSVRMGARELIGADTDEPILLQGVIDCCFMEDGRWVIVDYKTDYVDPLTGPEATAKRHSRQLALYASALTGLTGVPVKARYVHLLRTGDSVEV